MVMEINTCGGASTQDVSTNGGDFVGRDRNIYNIFVTVVQQTLESQSEIMPKQSQIIDWSQVEQFYYEKMVYLYDTLRIPGKSKPVSLDGIFTDVYVLGEITADRSHDLGELRQQRYDRFGHYYRNEKRVNGLELVKQGQNLYILGKPGIGKTTFLKYIALQAAKYRSINRIPIFLSLYEWVSDGYRDLNSFIVRQFELCNIPYAVHLVDALLQSGQVIVLFDGLDEVQQVTGQRQRIVRLLQNFAKQYHKVQCLITCRIAANDYTFQGFSDVEVADFTEEQVAAYVHKWFSDNHLTAEDFLRKLNKSEQIGIKELCSVPLLLSLLCLTFGASLNFPLKRSEVYRDAMEALLRKWDDSRAIQRDQIYQKLSYQQKIQLFATIANESFIQGDFYFTEDWLVHQISTYLTKLYNGLSTEEINGHQILKAIETQHGIFVQQGRRIYSFSHLTFQEYFVALYCASNEAEISIKDLISTHLLDERWRDIFILMATMLKSTDEMFATMIQVSGGLISHDPILLDMITWATLKAGSVNISKEKRLATRLAYIVLALSRSRPLQVARTAALALDLALEQARTLAHTLALSLAHSIAHALDLDRDLASVFDLTRALTRTRKLTYEMERNRAINTERSLARELDRTSLTLRELMQDLERALARDLERYGILSHTIKQSIEIAQNFALEYHSALALDYALFYIWQIAVIFAEITEHEAIDDYMINYSQYWKHVITISRNVDDTQLTGILNSFTIPQSDSTAWNIFANKVLDLIQNRRNLGFAWELEYKQIENLKKWFIANELTIRCVKLASSNDQQVILTRLLLPTPISTLE